MQILLTDKEITQDIIGALKNPPHAPDSKSDRWIELCILGVIIAIGIFYSILWVLVALLLMLPLYFLGARLLLNHRIKHVCISDYEIKSATVSNTDYEYMTRSKYHSHIIQNYTVHFEGGTEWRIPKDNYPWCTERRMSDWAVYKSTHRGDEYIIVVKKKTGKIVMGYSSAFFEYRQ